MKYHYEPGAVRWSRHDGKKDVRLCVAPKGWERMAYQLDRHPITGEEFVKPHMKDRSPAPQWWFRDEYVET